MSKRTATLLVGGMIALIVYVGITIAALVRDLDSMSTPEPRSADAIAQTPPSPVKANLQLNENRSEPGAAVLRPRKRRIKSVGHHAKRMKEPTTLLLIGSRT